MTQPATSWTIWSQRETTHFISLPTCRWAPVACQSRSRSTRWRMVSLWTSRQSQNLHFPENSPCKMCFSSLVPLRTPELSLTSRSPTDILVSWQPLPPKLSRGRVSAYRLSYRTATDDQVISVELPVPSENCTQYLLQGLQPDTIYLIRMSASTRVGWSQPSAWNSHRTPKTSSTTGERRNLEQPYFGP